MGDGNSNDTTPRIGLLAIIAVIYCALQIVPPELANYSFRDDLRNILRNIAMVGGDDRGSGRHGGLYVASIDQSSGALTATLMATAGEPIDVAVQPNTGRESGVWL